MSHALYIMSMAMTVGTVNFLHDTVIEVRNNEPLASFIEMH